MTTKDVNLLLIIIIGGGCCADAQIKSHVGRRCGVTLLGVYGRENTRLAYVSRPACSIGSVDTSNSNNKTPSDRVTSHKSLDDH